MSDFTIKHDLAQRRFVYGKTGALAGFFYPDGGGLYRAMKPGALGPEGPFATQLAAINWLLGLGSWAQSEAK
jgi:hypothetical protein